MGVDKRAKKVKAKTIFYDLFIGEWVDIITKFSIEIAEHSESGMSSSKTPMVLSGYVIDIDAENIYLGPELYTVSQAIRKDEYISIQVVEKEQPKGKQEKIPENKDLN